MRTKILLTTVIGALVATAAACSSAVQVKTAVAPDANLAGLHTFSVLAMPERRSTAPALAATDPMLNNSITNTALRNDIVQGLQSKGYTPSESNPDFQVAYYAGTKQALDTTYWNPGPLYRYGYRGFGLRRSRYAWAWPYYGAGPGFAYGPGMRCRNTRKAQSLSM